MWTHKSNHLNKWILNQCQWEFKNQMHLIFFHMCCWAEIIFIKFNIKTNFATKTHVSSENQEKEKIERQIVGLILQKK